MLRQHCLPDPGIDEEEVIQLVGLGSHLLVGVTQVEAFAAVRVGDGVAGIAREAAVVEHGDLFAQVETRAQ